ncbi:MAG: FHA domain-containing protein [Anaerolineae bacterium]|nr:FHA domain-containing protein [Anaerolineae bacterium]
MSEVQAYLTDLQGQVVATVAPSELITFGQHESNTIQLDDFSISPQHGAIAYRGGAFVVERWSRGRIWINSQQHPVEGSRMLQDNDRVLIGNRHVFVFHLGTPQVSAPTVPAMPSSPPEPVRTMVEGATPPPPKPGKPRQKTPRRLTKPLRRRPTPHSRR